METRCNLRQILFADKITGKLSVDMDELAAWYRKEKPDKKQAIRELLRVIATEQIEEA